MAEIKLNDAFAEEVNAFRTASESLDKVSPSSISGEGLSLATVNEYKERVYKIRALMIHFQALVRKDANDMDALAKSLKEADGAGGR